VKAGLHDHIITTMQHSEINCLFDGLA